LRQSDFLNDDTNNMPYIKYGDGNYIDYGTMGSGYCPNSGEYLYWDGAKLHIWSYAGNIIRHMRINYTDTLGRVISKIDARIPANTNTNGTYKLQSSTTAGNATYSWVEDSGGGATYTAGNGISISNDVISSTVEGLPTPPTTDGNYILKVSVSSGTPTYSWVEVTEGGSY
jgi:hypothetical protein